MIQSCPLLRFPLPSTPARPHTPALPRAQLGRHPFTPLIPTFRAPNSSNLQLPRVATLLALSHSPEPGVGHPSAKGRAGGQLERRPWGGVRTHQPEVRRSRGPGPGRGAVGCSAKAAAPEAGAGRGPRGGHSLARTPGPAPRGEAGGQGFCPQPPQEGERGLRGVGAPETPQERRLPRRALKAPQPSSDQPRPLSAPLLGLDAPARLLRPRRPRAPPRAPRWRPA